jgi:hypothetical protein
MDLVKAVNQHGGLGRWSSDVSMLPVDLTGILRKHNTLIA